MKKRPLDVRLDPLHAEVLQRLQALAYDKYPIDTVRRLIREAAIAAGVWPTPDKDAEK
jgi:hypothetical protein